MLFTGPDRGAAGWYLMHHRYQATCRHHSSQIERSIGTVDVRPDVAAENDARVDAEHAQLAWTHPRRPEVVQNAAGWVTATTPWRGVDYWRMTRHPDLGNYTITPALANG
jgi:4-hydroxyacetophenone monooxygenase